MDRGFPVLLLGAVVLAQAADADALREGNEALRSGDYTRAAATFEEGLKANPDSVELWFNLGRARAALEDSAAALAAYGKALEIDPAHAKALNNTANIYFRQGRYEEAAGWYRKALDVDPDYLLALFHYGWVQRQLGHSQEAEQSFAHCLALEANDEQARHTREDCRFYLGALRFRDGDYAKSASIMEQVLAANPANIEARYYLGMSYRGLGRVEDAKRQLEIHAELLQATRRDSPIERRPE